MKRCNIVLKTFLHKHFACSFVYVYFLFIVPEGVSAPILTANSSRSVVIKWVKPEVNNGVIICYTIQRLEESASVPVTVIKLTASFWNSYTDVTVKPFTNYRYRVVAETSVGGTPSPYNAVKTPQAGIS